MAKEYIRDFYGKILGDVEDRGSKIVAHDFYGRELGSYDKSRDETRDFYGRIICSGNGTVGLIMKAQS